MKVTEVSDNLRDLSTHVRLQRQPYYAAGTWGYTVLRTVYTPESDALFPAAIERLKRYVHYLCHHFRFPAYGPLCEREKVDFAEPSEELFRRFYVDVVEDREGLGHLDSGGNSPERFIAIAAYFRQWLRGVDMGDSSEKEPRFRSCLVIDSESLALLATLSDELPPLRCATSRQEKVDRVGVGDEAWLWLLEVRYMGQPDLHQHDPYPGWLRVRPSGIKASWFTQVFLNDNDHWFCLWHDEQPEGSGIYYHSFDGL